MGCTILTLKHYNNIRKMYTCVQYRIVMYLNNDDSDDDDDDNNANDNEIFIIMIRIIITR